MHQHPLLQSLRINQVVGFLAAGVLVGPFGLGLLSERLPVLDIFTIEGGQGVDALAELGVLFLMFAIGLELSTARLWALRRWVFAGGAVQLLLTAIAIGGAAWMFGNASEAAVVLGLVLALSSTAAVMQLLGERHAMGTPLGRAAFAILMLQDLAVVPLFLLLRVMADGETANLLPVLGLFAIKAVVLVVVFCVGGLPLGRAVEGGLLMGQGGEFAFIVIGFAVSVDLINGPLAQFMLLVVGLSLFVTPAMSRVGRLWGDWLERRRAAPVSPLVSLPESLEGKVLICGFGRIGQLLAEILETENIPYIALDSDARLASRLYASGHPVYFGDAERADVLRHLQAGSAAAVVLTMDQAAPAMHALAHLRREWPELPVFARARDEQQALALRQAGATMVFPETLESGLQIALHVLQRLGQTEAMAAQLVERVREQRVAMTDVAHK